MNKISALLLTFCLLTSFKMFATPDTRDAEGFPVMYLRSDQNGWRVQDDYRFAREGNTYSITIDNLNGEFKVGGDNWQYNLGKQDDGVISGSVNIMAVQDGGNFIAQNLKNLTITFSFDPQDASDGFPSTIVKFIVDGKESTDVPVKGLSGTLPVLYINVYQTDADGKFITDAQGNKIFNDEVTSKDLADKNYRSGEYWFEMNGCQWALDMGGKDVGSKDEPLPLEIKARGNYTRTAFAKKPFKLKLGKKQNLLNMNVNGEKSKHWAILAGADDNKGYLRNIIGFHLGELIGLPWTPRQEPIEVVINGDYRGMYLLTESIRVGDGRVPVTELKDNVSDPELVSGGYVVELDNYDEENQIRMDEVVAPGVNPAIVDRLRITFDTPEEYSDLQYRFINDQFTSMNNAIANIHDDTLWSYIDLDDAVRYYICCEIISHTEAFHGSTYLFRDYGANQKWHFSPLWDMGNAFNGNTESYFYNCSPFGNTWIPSMRAHQMFNSTLGETWLWFMSSEFDEIYDHIDTFVEKVREGAKADHRRWADAPRPQGGQGVQDNSDMDSRRNDVLWHMNAKINWLKGKWGNYATGQSYPEPPRDATPAAALPSYVTVGVDGINADAAAGPAVYYNMQGRRIEHPAVGGLYIVVRDGKATKEIMR